jgi:hypothetical protein
MAWEYTTVEVDRWIRLGVQGGAKGLLDKHGRDGWEAFAVAPLTLPRGGEPDPDASTYEILRKRKRRT